MRDREPPDRVRTAVLTLGLGAALLAAVLFGAWLRVWMVESIATGVVDRRVGPEPESDRDTWRVSVGGGQPPEVRLFTQHIPGPPPEERLRAMVLDVLVLTCGESADPLGCVDEITTEAVKRMGKK